MILTRLLKSKYNDSIRSYPLNDKTIEMFKEMLRLYDKNKVQRIIIKPLTEDQKKKISNPPDFFLEFIEENKQIS